MISPGIGEVVHVSGADGRCRAAIVLDTGPAIIRVRVLHTSLRKPGERDEEGDVRHSSEAQAIPNPPEIGGFRVLDTWHHRDNGAAGRFGGCSISAERMVRAAVVGS